jgi:hypothetical protein
MAVPEDRKFEFTATVNFPSVPKSELQKFAAELKACVAEVLSDYPTAVAYLLTADVASGDVTYGVRFDGADPKYIADMADEILDKATDMVAAREGAEPIAAEREESMLALA